MESNELGKTYAEGEVIFRQGESGSQMYVIQDGKVEVVLVKDGQETILTVLGGGDFFGEMALFDNEVRSATVRALGKARVLSVDKRNLMRRVHEDPSLAYRIIQGMSQRIRELNAEVAWFEKRFLEISLGEGKDLKG